MILQQKEEKVLCLNEYKCFTSVTSEITTNDLRLIRRNFLLRYDPQNKTIVFGCYIIEHSLICNKQQDLKRKQQKMTLQDFITNEKLIVYGTEGL